MSVGASRMSWCPLTDERTWSVTQRRRVPAASPVCGKLVSHKRANRSRLAVAPHAAHARTSRPFLPTRPPCPTPATHLVVRTILSGLAAFVRRAISPPSRDCWLLIV